TPTAPRSRPDALPIVTRRRCVQQARAAPARLEERRSSRIPALFRTVLTRDDPVLEGLHTAGEASGLGGGRGAVRADLTTGGMTRSEEHTSELQSRENL